MLCAKYSTNYEARLQLEKGLAVALSVSKLDSSIAVPKFDPIHLLQQLQLQRRAMEAKAEDDHSAFVEKFLLLPPSPTAELPLHGLTFAIKDMSVRPHNTNHHPQSIRFSSSCGSTCHQYVIISID